MLDPTVAEARMETREPKRPSALRLKAEPSVKQSTAERLDPSLACLLRDRVELIVTCWITEKRDLSCVEIPPTESAELIRATALRLKLDPRLACDTRLRLEPNLALARRL